MIIVKGCVKVPHREISRWDIPRWKVPREYRSWVMDKGSLTERLKHASKGDFQVRVTRLGWGQARYDEHISLGTQSSSLALIREVELICNGNAWVRARSIIPVSTLSGKERCLRHLGNKPLGEYLFKSRHMTRSRVVPFCQIVGSKRLYGRSSVFYLHHKPLLVSELFLPELLKHAKVS